jgi:hypothetical protein
MVKIGVLPSLELLGAAAELLLGDVLSEEDKFAELLDGSALLLLTLSLLLLAAALLLMEPGSTTFTVPQVAVKLLAAPHAAVAPMV